MKLITNLPLLFLQATETNQALQSLTGFFQKQENSVHVIVKYISVTTLALGSVYVIWALVTGKEGAWKYVVALFIAIIFALIFIF